MTTSRVDLLAGVDMEGGENFCDSIYNFLKNQGKDINLFTNSGFGVWSQSDTNKGLATLVYDNLAGGVFGVGDTITGATSGAMGKLQTDNGATSMTLGAVSGTFQDNEQIGNGAGVTADVDGDATIGIRNDPMNNNSVGLWTDDGAGITLAFVAAEYTVTTNAGNQRAWIANAALEAGKLYKIEIDIKDGTAAGADIECYFDDGAAQYGRAGTTAAGWASIFWTFECATATAAGKVGFRIPTSLAASNIEIRRFSCYEITPCCTAGDAVAFDYWDKDTTIDIYREYSGTNSHDGSFYGLKMVPTTAADFVQWPHASIQARGEHVDQFKGRPVTFGAWVKTSTASHARLWLSGSVGNTYSAYHQGDGNWEWLEVTQEFDQATTYAIARVVTTVVGDVDGTTIVYVSQPMLIFGWSLGEGMYQPRPQETIWFDKYITSKMFHTISGWSNTGGWVTLNLEADSDGVIPKGVKAVGAYIAANDLLSAGNNVYMIFKGKTTSNEFLLSAAGITNDASRREYLGLMGCDLYGDLAYWIQPSGAGNWDFGSFHWLVVQIP